MSQQTHQNEPTTCKNCGKTLYTGRNYCDECYNEAEEASKKLSKQIERKARRHRPSVALVKFCVYSAIYIAVLVGATALLTRHLGLWWVALIEIASCIASLFIGAAIGTAQALNYGEAARTPFRLFGFFVFNGVCLADYLFYVHWFDSYSFGMKWVLGCMMISISVFVFACLFSMNLTINMYYCEHCKQTNMLNFSHTAKEEVAYGYKYKNHSGYRTSATITHGYNNIEKIEYDVPGYQENLGLHKKTTKDNVYRCKCCGWTKTAKESNTEKVDF